MRRSDDEILIEGNSFDVTKREALVSVILVLLLLCIAILTTVKVSDNVQVHNEEVGRILCIETPELFKHSAETNVGDVIANAEIQCVDPVTIDGVKGEYSYIHYRYEEEHYKSREVTETKTRTVGYDKDGNPITETYTETHTEWYWEWDLEKWEDITSSKILINGIPYEDKTPSRYFKSSYANADNYEGDYSQISSQYIYLSTHKRISYELGELTSSGIIKCNLGDNSVKEIDRYYYGELDPHTIRESLKHNETALIIGTWIGFAVLTAAVVTIFVHFENNWLYNKKEDDYNVTY